MEVFFLAKFFGRNFLGRFLGGFFGEDFWEDIFGRNDLGGILCLYWYLLVCQDFGFSPDFVQSGKDKNLDPQKCDCKYIALKNQIS